MTIIGSVAVADRLICGRTISRAAAGRATDMCRSGTVNAVDSRLQLPSEVDSASASPDSEAG